MEVAVKQTVFVALFIVCAVVITFGNTLSYGFVWDDHLLIGNSYFIRNWSELPRIFTSHFWSGHAEWKAYYRPLINVSYLVDYQIWGLRPLGYHLTNVLAHAAASLAVMWIGWLLFRSWLIGFAAALTFAVHPVHSQSVSFIAGRTDVIGTLFFLLSFGLYVTWRESGRRLAYLGSTAAFVLALLSKEMAVVLPLVLVAYEWTFPRESERRAVAAVLRRVSAPLAALAIFIFVRVFFLSDMLLERPVPTTTEFGARLLSTFTYASFYAWVTILPFPVSPSQTARFVNSVLDPRFLAAAAGMAVLLGVTLLAARRARAVLFFCAWFWLTLAPSLAVNLLPAATPIVADRFLYLPSVALCVILAMGLRWLAGEVRDIEVEQVRRAPMVGFAMVIVVGAILTLWRNEYWKDDLRLYYRMADTDPQSLIAAVNLGLVHLNRLEAQEAKVNLERALALAPHNSRVLVSYGLLRAETGEPDEGLRDALLGLGYEPREASLHAIVGRIYVIREDFNRASAHYREAARLQPHSPGHHYMMAYTLMKGSHLREAVQAFDEGEHAAGKMRWHHRSVDRLGGELFAERDRARAIGYWERYAAALRSVREPGQWENSELGAAEEALRTLRAQRG
jgi:tetratricopeptide (TPR) repeat protein